MRKEKFRKEFTWSSRNGAGAGAGRTNSLQLTTHIFTLAVTKRVSRSRNGTWTQQFVDVCVANLQWLFFLLHFRLNADCADFALSFCAMKLLGGEKKNWFDVVFCRRTLLLTICYNNNIWSDTCGGFVTIVAFTAGLLGLFVVCYIVSTPHVV